MASELILRVLIAAFFVFLAVAYSSKHAALRARDGDSRVYRGSARSQQRFGRRVFEIFRFSILFVMVARVWAPEIDFWLGALPMLETPLVGYLGLCLMVAGGWWVFYAHNYMGELWRSGVPDGADGRDHVRALLQTGPFGRSRNPIFLGVHVTQLGLFLAAPSVFTALCLTVGFLVLQRQVLVEERDLTAHFGSSYRAYASRTPRWL